MVQTLKWGEKNSWVFCFTKEAKSNKTCRQSADSVWWTFTLQELSMRQQVICQDELSPGIFHQWPTCSVYSVLPSPVSPTIPTLDCGRSSTELHCRAVELRKYVQKTLQGPSNSRKRSLVGTSPSGEVHLCLNCVRIFHFSHYHVHTLKTLCLPETLCNVKSFKQPNKRVH